MSRPTSSGRSSKGRAPACGPLSVKVSFDHARAATTLTFNCPITPIEASKFLFGTGSQSSRLVPLLPMGDKAHQYGLGTSDIDLLAQMRPDVFHAVMVAGTQILRSNAKPWADMPKWVPPELQKEIKTGRVPKGVTRYKRKKDWGEDTEDWGDIIVWRGNTYIELYWEFPAKPEFYERISDGAAQRRHGPRSVESTKPCSS